MACRSFFFRQGFGARVFGLDDALFRHVRPILSRRWGDNCTDYSRREDCSMMVITEPRPDRATHWHGPGK
jgi:hypothetical protein